MIKLINLLTEGYSFTGPKKMGGEDDGEVIYNFKNKKGDMFREALRRAGAYIPDNI